MHILSKKGIKFYQKFDIDMEVHPAKTPEIAHIPLDSTGGDPILKISVGDKVKKYDLISVSPSGFPTYSGFSGEFLGFSTHLVGGLGKYLCADIKTIEEKTFLSNANFDKSVGLSFFDLAKKFAIIDPLDQKKLIEKIKDKNFNAVYADCVDGQPYAIPKTVVLDNFAEEVLLGLRIISSSISAKKCGIIIQKNIRTRKFLKLKKDFENIDFIEVSGKYPQSVAVDEFVDTENALHISVQTCRAVYRAAAFGIPQVSSVVTVWGDGLSAPKNLEVTYGTKVRSLIEECGAFGKLDRIIAGGLMTGAGISLDAPIVAGINVLAAVPTAVEKARRDCTSCGKCVEICPKGLTPIFTYRAVKNDDIKKIAYLRSDQCIGCGCCSYVCPAMIPLTAVMSGAKGMLDYIKREEEENA